MANDKDFKVKNGVKASAYYEAMGTVTSSVDNVGPVSAFSTDLYTGDATTSKKITNNIDLSTDGGLVWIKRRSDTSDHRLMDTERGASSYLASNTTSGASTGALSSFDTDGFTIGNASAPINANGSTYVAWSFKKQSSFFDVVEYTGDGVAGRTVSHNLGSVPGCIIVKCTSAGANWVVYHRGTDATAPEDYGTKLSGTFAREDNVVFWNDTAPTSTEFTVGTGSLVNSNGATYVAYLFAHDTSDDGYIQCGSYTGNGSTNGPEINLGWKPQWIMVKNATAVSDWRIFDTTRGWVDGSGDRLLSANQTSAEAGGGFSTPTSTGFSIDSTGSNYNTSGETYIYIAIRESTSTNKRTLDLSTGSVFEVTADADVQIGLSNPAPSGTVSSATLILNGGSKTTYDIANLKGANEKANLSTLSCQYPDVATSPLTGVFLSTDGDKLYTTDDDTYHVYQYNILRPPYLDSAVLSGDLYVGGTTGTQIDSLFFKPDGTKMYQLDKGNDAVYQWDLSTAWEISTAAYNSKQLSVASQATLPAGLWFKSDGSSLYVLDETTDDVFQYDLTTAWDVSTGSYASKSIDETAKEDGIIFNSDGTKIFIGTDLEEYNLSTAWDISTASASGSTAGGSYNRYTEVFTLSASSTGKYLYYSDRTRAYPNKVYGHTSPFREQRVSRIYFGTAYDISYDSSIKFRAKSERSSFNVGETRVITFTTRDGGTTYMAQEVMKGIDEDV